MAGIRFEGVSKVFKDGVVAVRDLWLDVADGEFMILVGPSGCGKTTALRMVAGLEEVSEGRIVIGDSVVNDVEPGRRDVAMVFQNYALFPHMTVRDNISFPLRMRGFAKKEIAGRVEETAKLLGLEGLLARKPNELSGGQRQRVAMGRAIIRHPRAFLLDEPLSNLDAKLRAQMRAELARLHRRLGVTSLYVTHDQTEAMTLGSRVAVLRDGVLQQVGTPQELYRRPANAFVGRFMGSPAMNLIPGHVVSGVLEVDGGSFGGRMDVSAWWPEAAGDLLVGVRPEAWREGPGAPDEAISMRGEVEVVEELGPETLLYVRYEGHNAPVDGENVGGLSDALAVRIEARRAVSPGEVVECHAEAASVHLFDPETGEALARREWAEKPAGVDAHHSVERTER